MRKTSAPCTLQHRTMDWADVGTSFRVVPSNVSGLGTHEHVNTVGFVEETVLDDHGCTVSDQTVTFHFTESQTTLSSTTFGWLTGEDLNTAT